MHPNAKLIEKFYKAFAKRDGKAMAACYADDATFKDPVFTLEGWRIGAMWRMLCERGKDLKVKFSNVRGDDGGGSAHWNATYTFSVSGRKVQNSIDATFEIRDGLIVHHEDRFDLHAWATQALGMKGRLLGGTPMMKKRIRAAAKKALDEYAKEKGLAP